ncbi:Elongation factor 2, partial [Ascosphaera pollenicola]
MDTLAELYYSSTKADAQMMAAVDLKDFTRYLQERSPVGEREAFWKKYLDVETTRENSHLKPSPAATEKKTRRVERYSESLVEDVGPAIEQARRHGVSIQAVFLACFARAWKKLLSKADGKDREVIVMGVYLSNRGHALDGLSQMAAPTLNIVPLRVDVSREGEREVEIAERVQGDLQRVSSVENSCVSLAEVKKWTGVEIDVFVNFLAEQEQQEAGLRLAQQEAQEDEDQDDDP